MEGFSDSIKGIIDDAIERNVFPGAVFSIIQNNEVVHSGSYGRFTYDKAAPPMRTNTVFDIASVTKALVASCALVLVKRGEINLDSTVESYLHLLLDSQVGKVKVIDLLSHTSGIRIKMSEYALSDVETFIRTKLRNSATVDLSIGGVEYSNVNTFLLGEIIAKATGLSLDEAMVREIFEPLGMKRTTYSPSKELITSIPPTEILTTHQIIQGIVHDESAREMRRAVGHAGIFSNAPDLLKFLSTWLNPGQILSEKDINAALEKKSPDSGLVTPLGWHLDNSLYLSERAPTKTFFHPGFTGTIIGGNRESKLGFVFLSNCTYPDRTGHKLKNAVFRDIFSVMFNTFR
jgi:CubicO group peptidase (beta-lactamase class C family)